MKTPILLFTAISFLFSGCFQQIAVKSLGGIMDSSFEVLNEEQDMGIAEVSIASDLKLLEAILKSDPENEHYLFLATMGYASYALGFIEDESPERARLFYLRSKEYGMRILNRNKQFRLAQNSGAEEFYSALESFSQDDLPAIFWTAAAWGSYISLNLTDPDALADLPKIEQMMKFVAQKEPTYFYGGAYFFLGTLAGSRPQMLGGDPELSKQHFEQCLKINNGKFLMTYVYYARSYAVQTQNKELFKQCLATVDTASIEILPEARLTNAVAKKKAKILLEKIDELFETQTGDQIENQ
jgi:hypothetical protein